MDDDLRQLERTAARDPSLEGQLLNALVRSGQLERDRMYAGALLYHRGARDALGWPAHAPIVRTQASADGAVHAVARVYMGPALDRARKVGASALRPLCGATAALETTRVELVSCSTCVAAWADEGPGLVATAEYSLELAKLPGDQHLAMRAAWLAERAALVAEGRAQDWERDLDAVARWLIDPTPTNLRGVTAVLALLGEDDERLTCALLAVHGARMNDFLLHDVLTRAENALGSAATRELLARLGAWVVGRGPDPVVAT